MRVALPYADGTLSATLPPGSRLLLSGEATAVPPPLADLAGAVREALGAPLGLPRLRDLARPGARVTIAFDDHTTGSFGPIRPVAIRAVMDELAAAGVSASQVRLVCANAL
ncbi:MAG TPA: lactate racemase domain-containing protein, partial [Methylomirabilota bacterium]|nr:lactate racemase domain-containing protein [Methylomirabilota bacterium]